MPKRFTETGKWDDPWFDALDPIPKLFWIYLCDRCDAGGVWEPNERHMDYHFRGLLSLADGLSALGDRVVVLPNGKWLLTKFLEFQYPGGLRPDVRPHQAVFRALQSHGLQYPIDTLSDKSKGLSIGVSNTPKDKDTDIDIDKDQDGGDARGGDEDIMPSPAQLAKAMTVTKPPVRMSFLDWQLTHPRVFIGRTGESGDRESWSALFDRWFKGDDYSTRGMDAMYTALLPTLKPRGSIFFNQACEWLESNFDIE
jgi:hypothetical protein